MNWVLKIVCFVLAKIHLRTIGKRDLLRITYGNTGRGKKKERENGDGLYGIAASLSCFGCSLLFEMESLAKVSP